MYRDGYHHSNTEHTVILSPLRAGDPDVVITFDKNNLCRNPTPEQVSAMENTPLGRERFSKVKIELPKLKPVVEKPKES